MDGAWKAARAFSVVAFVLGLLLLLSSLFSCCDGFRTLAFGCEAPLYLLLSLSLGLTLLLLDSDACDDNALVKEVELRRENLEFPETCGISQGARLVISAMSFYLVAAVLSFMAHKEEEEEMKEAAEAGLNEPLNA